MIITAQIAKIEKHPDASKLKICHVNDGAQLYQVVCGAVNCREGMITILAKPGSITPQGIEIKEAELRGIKSQGMLCSSKDLGITQESGIIDLPPATKLGLAYNQLDVEILSSTPWHQYKETQSYYLSPLDQLIHTIHADSGIKKQKEWKLISKTYFINGNYLHRHFN